MSCKKYAGGNIVYVGFDEIILSWFCLVDKITGLGYLIAPFTSGISLLIFFDTIAEWYFTGPLKLNTLLWIELFWIRGWRLSFIGLLENNEFTLWDEVEYVSG